MGQAFFFVNPAKKQFLNPSCFAENNKAGTYLEGNHARAVALLVVNPTQVSVDNEPDHNYGPMAGSWFGDPIYAAGDDCGPPNQFGIVTATEADPNRNLFFLAEAEYEDISYKAIAMMCMGRFWHETGTSDFAEELAERARRCESLLMELGNVVFTVGCPPLEDALKAIIGDDWISRYEQAYKKCPWMGTPPRHR
jgi:hypothetical protein